MLVQWRLRELQQTPYGIIFLRAKVNDNFSYCKVPVNICIVFKNLYIVNYLHIFSYLLCKPLKHSSISDFFNNSYIFINVFCTPLFDFVNLSCDLL